MRVLLLSDPFPPVVWGGYELEARGVAETLLAAGHEVLVLSGDAEADGLAPQPGVHRVLHHDRDGDPRDTLASPLRALQADRVARSILARRPPDVLYVFNGSGVSRVVLVRCIQAGVPLILRASEHWVSRLLLGDRFLRELVPGRVGRARRAWAGGMRAVDAAHPRLRLAPERVRDVPAAVAWVTRSLRELAPLPAGLLDVRHETVFPPAGPELARFAAVLRTPAPTPELLVVGRLEPGKGPDVAVRALAALGAEHATTRLVLIGPGSAEDRGRLGALAAGLGVAERVELRGRVAPAEVAAAMGRAHALIVPPLWDEPAGLSVLEGALAGVPLVVSDVGGPRELVGPEHGARYVPRGEVPALAAAVAGALAGGEAVARDVARARERALDIADPQQPWRNYETFFADACAALELA